MPKPRSELILEKCWLRTLTPDDLDAAPMTNVYIADYRLSLDGLFTLVQVPTALLELEVSGSVRAAAKRTCLLDLLQEVALSTLPKEKRNELLMLIVAYICSDDVNQSWQEARQDADQFTPHILLNIHDGTQGVMVFPHLFVSQEDIERGSVVAEYSKKIARLSQQAYPSLFLNHRMKM